MIEHFADYKAQLVRLSEEHTIAHGLMPLVQVIHSIEQNAYEDLTFQWYTNVLNCK